MSVFSHKLILNLRPCVTSMLVTRWAQTKPWRIGPDGEWRKARAKKVFKAELPDFNESRRESKMTPEEVRSKMKEKGIVPPVPYSEKPLCISCSNAVFEQYIPPEGDGKLSIVTSQGAKQRAVRVEKKAKSLWAIRRIRTFDDDWDPQMFGKLALELYVKAHEALAAKDEDALHQLVTEYIYPQMVFQTEKKTIKWKFIDSLELPRVSHVRTTEIITKNNEFAQITVRLHTRQILAIYDRFGNLMYGSDAIVKDVLEYVVFEKHIASEYGVWRLHAKIIPEWMPQRQTVRRTYRKPPPPPPLTEDEIKEKEELKDKQEKEEEVDEKGTISEPRPAVA